MNKTLTGIALALVVIGGAGYGFYSQSQKEGSSPNISVEAEKVAGTVEPAADADDSDEDDVAEAPKTSTDNPVVAKVDGKPIVRSEVLDFMKNLPPQMAQMPPQAIFPMVLEQVINGKIVDEKAKEANIGDDPAVQEKLADAKVQIIRAVYAEQEINKKLSEADVKKAYDDMVKQMPKTEEVHARHILVDDEAKAKEIITKLDGGAKFEDMAKEFSKDKSNSASGGDLGYFAQGDMVKEFGDAAFSLKKGAYTTTPVKTQFGYHIIQSEDKRVRPAPKFDDVKGQLEGQVRRDILNKLIEEWHKGAKIETFDFDGKPLPKAEDKPEEKEAE